MSTQTDHEAFFAVLEETGEATVRANLAKKVYGPKSDLAHEWLRSKEPDKRDEREEETLSIAKEANRIASKALRSDVRSERAAYIAAAAAIIAAIAAISDSSIFSSSSTGINGETNIVITNESPNKTN